MYTTKEKLNSLISKGKVGEDSKSTKIKMEILTKTLAIADFPSSAPFLSVAFTSNPNTRPASLENAATALTKPVTGSIANLLP